LNDKFVPFRDYYGPDGEAPQNVIGPNKEAETWRGMRWNLDCLKTDRPDLPITVERLRKAIETLKANGCRGPIECRVSPDADPVLMEAVKECGLVVFEKGAERPERPAYTRLARNRWG
jgi:hypothetical protein